MADKTTIITSEIKESILYIGLNRPEKRNALNDACILELDRLFTNLPKSVKCGIIYGHGEHFSAGLDLSELQERDAMEGWMHSRMWHSAMDKIQLKGIPVIAKIQGACVGGGLELAASAHIRVTEDSAFFAMPEGTRGIFVGGGASVRLPKLIGAHRMVDMMLTGRIYKAAEGYQLGFSQYLTENGKGMEKATELAKRICQNAPMTNLAITQVLPRIADAGQDIGLMMESLAASIAQSAPEAKKRLRDFLEGRAKKVGE